MSSVPEIPKFISGANACTIQLLGLIVQRNTWSNMPNT